MNPTILRAIPEHALLFIIGISLILNSCSKTFSEKDIDAASAGLENLGRKQEKPNVLLILADDVGYEVPTVNGGESYQTPNIDQLANSGLRFTQAQAAPMCSPSRFMLMTGKYNFRNYDKWGQLGLDQRTIANMLQDAGYDTYAAGKWQLDGGDNAVRTFGFNEYILYNMYETKSIRDSDGRTTGRYKNPELFSNGKFLPFGSTIGKYGPDIFADSVKSYMEKSVRRNKPFFIYYSMTLCHLPFSPTPDDPEFATWDPKKNSSDARFFPSMVNYMDKKIGEVLAKLNEIGISGKTLVLFLGDNGTPHEIYSIFNGEVIQGGKMQTHKYGVHVPMVAFCQGKIRPGVNENLIDLTDMLPTIADVAGLPLPSDYGTLDGKSFYKQLAQRKNAPARDWVFCHYLPNQQHEKREIKNEVLKRFIYNTNYKLYDSTYRFYDIENDPYETRPIDSTRMTKEQRELTESFKAILDTLH